MKISRHGKSEPIDEQIYLKIRKALLSPHHRLFLDLAYYTGERWGAIIQLRVEDIYLNPLKRIPHSEITYRAKTRKDNKTRQVPIAQKLQRCLESYQPPASGWLFPSPKNSNKPLTLRTVDYMLRRALEKTGLQGQGYSGHGTRRNFITCLHDGGIKIGVIQSLTGHENMANVALYINVTEKQRVSAIALL